MEKENVAQLSHKLEKARPKINIMAKSRSFLQVRLILEILL